eukprot:7273917-Karenia_brevis.AAC.1
MKVWQESWASSGQHGYRARHGAEDIYWVLALQIEQQLLEGGCLYGISLDYAKCFDRIPHGILLRL